MSFSQLDHIEIYDEDYPYDLEEEEGGQEEETGQEEEEEV